MSPLHTSRLRAEAVRIARSNVGYGEHNRTFLALIGAKPDAEWCAVFVAYCYSKAAGNLKLPRTDWCFRRPGLLEPGAKRLTKNLGKVGSIWKPFECDADRPMAGDLVCWSRGILGWTGHVGIIAEMHKGGFISIEGNVGQKVVQRWHSFDEPKLWRFASIEQ